MLFPKNPNNIADVAYTYDALGRQLTETSGGKQHVYAYDLANNRVTVTYGGTDTVLTSTYDALNRDSTLSELPASAPPSSARLTIYGYDLSGNRVFLRLPNGEETDTVYDALNRRTDTVTTKTGGGSLLELEYAYDLVGNVARITETYPGSTLSGRTVTNTYDGVNRLTVETTEESGKTVETTYTFDKANNRTEKSVATTIDATTTTVATTYDYNNLNQLQTATTGGDIVDFTYDHNGNRETRTADALTDTYTYDYENRLLGLTKATAGGTGAYAYVYDYRTRRVQRTESGTTTALVFSGGVSVQEYEVATATTLAAEYIRGSDWGGGVGGLLYSVRTGVPSFKHYNSRGDVITATDTAGATTWQATYEAFGTRTQEVGTTQDRQKANTKEEDPTGLLNEGFRYRDLETGVFITRDPLGFVDGPNMYAYVVQNPWSKFDPLGLQSLGDTVEQNLEVKGAPPMGDACMITTGQGKLIKNGALSEEQVRLFNRIGKSGYRLPKLEFSDADLKAMTPAQRKRVEGFNRTNGYTNDAGQSPSGPSARKTQEGDVGNFGVLKKDARGSGVEIHESPSRVAQEKAFIQKYVAENGRPPSQAEINAARKNNPSVALSPQVHSQTDTYKGRNTDARSTRDASDLMDAAERGAQDLIKAGNANGRDFSSQAAKLRQLQAEQSK